MRLKDLGKLDLTSWKGAVSSRASAGTSFLSFCRWKVAVLMPSAARVGPAFLAAPGLIRKPKRRRQYQESARTQFHVGRMGGSPTIVYWMEARVACLRRGVSFGSVRGNRPGSGALLTRLVLRAGGREGGGGGALPSLSSRLTRRLFSFAIALLIRPPSPPSLSPSPSPFFHFYAFIPSQKGLFQLQLSFKDAHSPLLCLPFSPRPRPAPSFTVPRSVEMSLFRYMRNCICAPPLTSPSSSSLPHPPLARLLLP